MARHGRSYPLHSEVYRPAGGILTGGCLTPSAATYPSANTFPTAAVCLVTYTDNVTGTINLTGTRTASHVRSEAPSGQITLTGTRTDAQSRSESRSGQITLSGTRTNVHSHSGSCSGTVFLTGTRVESYLPPGAGPTYNDTCTGTINLTGAWRENFLSNRPRGTVNLTGTRVESFSAPTTHSDSPTGTITLSGLGAVVPETDVCEALYPSEVTTYPSTATYPVEPCPPGEDPVLSWLRVREKPSLNQSVMVTTPTGKVYRWGEDDPVPEKSFHSLAYGSGMPGGSDQMTATLPRKSGVDYSDLELFSNVQVMDAGGEVTGEYRLESAPVTAGGDFIITPNAVGWQAMLEDRKNCAVIYVDIDFSHWGSISNQFRIDHPTQPVTDGQVIPDPTTGAPAVATVLQQTDSSGATDAWGPAMYDCGPLSKLGSVYYAWRRQPNTIYASGPGGWQLYSDSVDTFDSAPDGTGDLRAAGPSTGIYSTGSVDDRYIVAEFTSGTGVGTGPFEIDTGVYWTMLAVRSNHGLTMRGSESATTAKGVYASDVINHAVSTYGQDLVIGTIDSTTFVIPQLEFREPTTCAEIIKGANRFHLYDWFVGPGKRFHYRQRGTYGRSWLARVGPSKLESTGQTVERCVTHVFVFYQDPDGTRKIAGPSGAGVDAESATLQDTDPQNPAVAAGIERYAILDMGQVSTGSAAIQVGARFLEEINQFDHSGRAELTGHVMNDAGVLFPYSSVQAGDTITFIDAADTSERRIIKATKGSNAVSIDLDAPPEGTQQLLDRLGVQWTNLSATGAPTIKPPGTLIRPTPFGTAGAAAHTSGAEQELGSGVVK